MKIRVAKYRPGMWLWSCPCCERFSVVATQPQAFKLGRVHIARHHRTPDE